MDGLDIDDEMDDMSMSRAQKVIQEQTERIRKLECVEEQYSRLQREYDRVKSDLYSSKQSTNDYSTDVLVQELKATKEALREKDRRIQYLEEANNRVVFRMRNVQVELSGKDNEIRDLNQEISFIKQKVEKPYEILINDIKQKDLIIEGYKRRERQVRSDSIIIRANDGGRLLDSSFDSVLSSYVSPISQQNHSYDNRKRFIRQNRVRVQDETEIINEWNKMLQVFTESIDPNLINHLKQYALLSISRLAMLAKNLDHIEEGIFSQLCYLCDKPFSCIYKPIVCSFCGYLFCGKCAPRKLPLGSKNEDRLICVGCEAMYRFVYKKDDN